MGDRKRWMKVYTVLTNGHDSIVVESNRYECYIIPPDGMTVTIANGEYYLNGEKARFELKMECEDDEGQV